jgi:hypothetical protein
MLVYQDQEQKDVSSYDNKMSSCAFVDFALVNVEHGK